MRSNEFHGKGSIRYNGTERICSRLGVNVLISTGSPTDIFYYHTNHLGSTAFVTDNNATITQGFLYAPFGEITTEYAPMWQNSVLPKYAFNAKELDEETGMYYYEARYYNPPVFTSRDPMMDQKPWLTPYHYCSNNPTGRVDPSGCVDMETDYRNTKGELLFHTDDGLNTTIIVEDANVPKLKQELQNAKDKGNINNAETNKSKMHSLGKTITEYSNAVFGPFDDDNFKMCYRDTYQKTFGKKSFFKFSDILEIIVLSQSGDSQPCIDGKNRGMFDAKSDWKNGKINRVVPESSFKNNKPIIKLF